MVCYEPYLVVAFKSLIKAACVESEVYLTKNLFDLFNTITKTYHHEYASTQNYPIHH